MISLVNQFLKYSNGYIVFFVILTLTTSCAKLEKDNSVEPEDDIAKLIIKIGGVNGAENGDLSLQAFVTTRLDNENADEVLHEEVIKSTSKFGDIEIGMISSENSIHTLFENDKKGLKNASKIQKLAATQSMISGVKYVFLIYDNANGNLLDAQIGTVGTALEIGVPRGGSFSWYAYSFNSSENMSLPTNLSVPEVRTQYNRPLLYKSGTISPGDFLSSDSFNLNLVFNHAIPKLNVKIDTRRMFADIASVSAIFDESALSTGLFKIKTGTIDPNSLIAESEVNRTLIFANSDAEEKRIKYLQGDYYTANMAISFNVKFSNLSVTYPDVNNTTQNIATALFSANAPATNSGQTDIGLATFSGYTPVVDGVAKELVGQLQPSLILTDKTFVLYGPANRVDKGFQAVATSNSGDFIRSSYNFGIESKYIKVSSMTFNEVYAINSSTSNLADRLDDPAKYPDVVICSMLTPANTTTADMSALETYLSRGGVVFLLTEDSPLNNVVTRDFLRNVLGEQTLTLVKGDDGGAVYKLGDVDPQVLNGLFGDIRGAYWGQDGSPTLFLQNITDLSKIVVYTEGASNAVSTSGISMFRSKNVNLFYAGDTGFLAGPQPSTIPSGQAFSSSNRTQFPYATKGGSGIDRNFPVSRGGFGITATNYTVSNSIIFANVLTWLLERSQFRGVNRN